MRHNIVETLVGAVVIIVAAAFVFYGYTLSEKQGTAGYELSAQFNRVDGLVVGSDVRLSGIKIGAVTAMTLDPETYSAIVSLVVNKDIALPDDSNAKITSEGLLGGNYISLSAGGSEDMLAAGDEIIFTQGAVDLLDLVGQALFSTGDDAKSE